MKNKYSLFFALCFLFFACSMPVSNHHLPSYDPDLFGWKAASMSPFSVNETVNAFAYGKAGGNDCYVALSSSGTIAWSEDGDVWRRVDPSPPGVFNAVAFGNGVFVAVGNGGSVACSGNGKEWTVIPVDNIGANSVMRGLAFGNGFFVAAGSAAGSGIIRHSIDGVIWQQTCSDFPPDTTDPNDVVRFNDVAYSNKKFHIVGNYNRWGYVLYDSGNNSFTWRPHSLTITDEIRGEIRKINVSDDANPFIGIIKDQDIGNDQWYRRPIVLNENETGAKWIYDCGDPDCSNEYCFYRLFWKPQLFKNPRNNANININDIAFGGGYFVAVSDAGVIGHLSGSAAYGFSGSKDALFGGGDRFWNAIHIPEFMETNIMTIEALNGRFFISNNTGKIGYSK